MFSKFGRVRPLQKQLPSPGELDFGTHARTAIPCTSTSSRVEQERWRKRNVLGGFYDWCKPMSDNLPPDRPSDDELPPDPFPGDPFSKESETSRASDGESSVPGDLSALLGSLGSMGGMGPLFAQVAAMQNQGSGLNWDVARQIALWTASGSNVESPPDPVERIKMERIAKSAESHVRDVSGLATSNGHINAVVTTRAGWAAQSLEDYRSLLDRLATSLGTQGPASSQAGNDASSAGQDPMAALLGMIAPMMISSQAGALLGELAITSLGSYDIPVPRKGASEQLLFVLRNVDDFASEWSVPVDHARTHVAIVEIAMHAVLRIPHVQTRLYNLIDVFVGSYVVDPEAIGEQLQSQFAAFDPSSFDPAGADNTGLKDLPDPHAILGAAETDAQRVIRAEIALVLTPIVGFVDYVAAVTGARMLGDNRKVVEAWRRRRLSPGKGKASAGQMLGLSFDDQILDQGAAFIGGVLQRAGTDGLEALWAERDFLPTSSEIVAPGLWLARVGLSD